VDLRCSRSRREPALPTPVRARRQGGISDCGSGTPTSGCRGGGTDRRRQQGDGRVSERYAPRTERRIDALPGHARLALSTLLPSVSRRHEIGHVGPIVVGKIAPAAADINQVASLQIRVARAAKADDLCIRDHIYRLLIRINEQ
jgi:hypothetical protein